MSLTISEYSLNNIVATGIREHACERFGISTHSDFRVARQILALGHQRLAGGISAKN